MRKVEINSNTFFNTLKSVFGMIFPLITFPYISRVLMADSVGKINFGQSVVSYFSLIASLGITPYAIRECSKVRNDQEKYDNIASEIYSINIYATLVSYALLIFVLMCAGPLQKYKTLICIQSTAIFFTTMGADWVNTTEEDFKYIAVRTISFQVLSFALILFFVHKPEDYYIYALISVVASSGANVINWIYRRRFCKITFKRNVSIKKHFFPILLLFSMQISQIVYCNSDLTMLGLMRSDFEVGVYSTAVRIYTMVNTTIASIAWVVMPQLTEGFLRCDYKVINRLLKYSLNFIVVLGFPCIVGINLISRPIIFVLAGEEYLSAFIPLHILSISLAISLLGGWISNMMLIPSGKEKTCLAAGALSAITNVSLNLFLIPLFGINAAATTTAIAEFVGLLFIRRKIDKRIKIDGIKCMLRAPIVGCIGITFVACMVRFFFESYIIIAFLTAILGAWVYVIILILAKDEFTINFLMPLFRKLKEG